jgi:hypothetical protein
MTFVVFVVYGMFAPVCVHLFTRTKVARRKRCVFAAGFVALELKLVFADGRL